MLKKIAIPIAILILATTLASFQYFKHRDDPMITDEAAWIFSSVYWTHFIHGELSHPDWRSLDAIDHPPLAKYYYGAVLSLRGLGKQSIADKNWWLAKSGDEGDWAAFEEGMRNRVSQAAIRTARAAAGATFVLFVMAMYALGTAAGGTRLGAIAAIAVAVNPLIYFFAPLVFADNLLMAFVCLQTAALIAWARLRIEGREAGSRALAIVAGVLLAFASLTKFNGMLQFCTTIVAVIVAMVFSGRGKRTTILQSFVIVAIAGLLIIMLNPANINSIEALPTLFKFRAGELTTLEYLSGASGMPVYDRLIFAWQAIFIDSGWTALQLPVPIGLMLAIAGAIAGIFVIFGNGRNAKSAVAFIILAAAVIWIPPTLWSYKQSLYKRYLLPILPWMGLAIAYASVCAIDLFRRAIKKATVGETVGPHKYAWIFGIIIFILSWNLIASSDARYSFAASIHRPSFRAAHLERIVRAHPDDTDSRLMLVEQYLALGNDKAAMIALKPALAARPDDLLAHALYSVLIERVGQTEIR